MYLSYTQNFVKVEKKLEFKISSDYEFQTVIKLNCIEYMIKCNLTNFENKELNSSLLRLALIQTIFRIRTKLV